MGQGEAEVLHQTLVVRAIGWETADFNAVLSLCSEFPERVPYLSIAEWDWAGGGSPSLLHQATASRGKEWMRVEHVRSSSAQEGVLPVP